MEPDAPKNSIPVSLQSLMADLDFLSQIKRNMKPCCNDRVLVDAESWSGAFYRFFKGESRLNVITKVEQIVHNAIEAIENKKFEEHLSLTVNSLYNALDGIHNLVFTYENDPNMKARLNVQIKNIDIQLVRYRYMIKGYQENKKPEMKKDVVIDISSIPEDTPIPIGSNGSAGSNGTATIDLLDSGSLEFDKKKLKRPIKRKDV